MRIGIRILFFILLFSSHSTFAKSTASSFVSRFKLIKKDSYYLTKLNSDDVFASKDQGGAPGKVFLVNNKKLEDLGLLMFYVQTDTCHACTVALWLYNENKRPYIVQLQRKAGSSGEPPKLLEIIDRRKYVYILLKNTFEGQGVEESTLEIIRYDKENPQPQTVYRLFLSDTSFVGSTNNCSGWGTKYMIDNEVGKIDFVKSGYVCNLDFRGSIDKSRNIKKIYKRENYVFDKN